MLLLLTRTAAVIVDVGQHDEEKATAPGPIITNCLQSLSTFKAQAAGGYQKNKEGPSIGWAISSLWFDYTTFMYSAQLTFSSLS